MKVVSYDPYNTAEPSGSLSGTSCPPQPHLEVMRTPPFLMYLETFPRGDHSMKVSYCNPLDTPGPPGPGSINHQSCVCVCVHVCVYVYLPGLLFRRHLIIAFLQKHQVKLSGVNLYLELTI